MFKKLRNKLILINLGITTIVIITVFSAIYIVSTRAANSRPPIPDAAINLYSDEMENLIEVTIMNEKEQAARQLLIMLITSGVAIELSVLFISYYMAEEAIKPVKEAYESQKIFIANASHEIKTPLAAISANLEAADIQDNKWIKNVELEAAKLTALNSELLTLARTDLVSSPTSNEADLRSLVKSTLSSLEPRLAGKKFTKHIDLPAKIKINSSDFIQILTILMDNAIKYSNKEISLSINKQSLTVANDGKTIDSASLPHVFDRFYQQDKTSEGVGLGLSIAKSLADRNGWRLTAMSDKVTTFNLQF